MRSVSDSERVRTDFDRHRHQESAAQLTRANQRQPNEVRFQPQLRKSIGVDGAWELGIVEQLPEKAPG